MNDSKQDHIRAKKILSLMMQSFDQSELDRLYFDLDVDSGGVPKPASKQAYIFYLMRHMAHRNRQKELTTKLKEIRNWLDWPETYALPTTTNEQKAGKSLHIEHYVQEQTINFHTTLRSNTPYRKSSRLDPPKIAEDLYNKAFKHTPILGWATLGIILLITGCLIILYYFNKPFWTDFGLMILMGIPFVILAIDKLVFSLLFNEVEKTNFIFCRG